MDGSLDKAESRQLLIDAILVVEKLGLRKAVPLFPLHAIFAMFRETHHSSEQIK
jgi:hypothetical protein